MRLMVYTFLRTDLLISLSVCERKASRSVSGPIASRSFLFLPLMRRYSICRSRKAIVHVLKSKAVNPTIASTSYDAPTLDEKATKEKKRPGTATTVWATTGKTIIESK